MNHSAQPSALFTHLRPPEPQRLQAQEPLHLENLGRGGGRGRLGDALGVRCDRAAGRVTEALGPRASTQYTVV